MSADADKGPGKARLCCLRQIDDLRDICQIVAGERDDVWPPDGGAAGNTRGDPRPADRSAAQCGRRSAPPRRRAQAPVAPAAKTPWCREGGRDGQPEASPELLPWKLSACGYLIVDRAPVGSALDAGAPLVPGDVAPLAGGRIEKHRHEASGFCRRVAATTTRRGFRTYYAAPPRGC